MKECVRARVKVCCIADLAEARLAIEAGASALGLVSEMPSGPGPIPESTIAAIAARVPPGVASVLLTARQDAAGIIDQQRRLRVNTLQLVDRLPAGEHQRLRDALPGVSLMQVVHVIDEDSVREAVAVAPEVDALLLDSGNPGLMVKALGGTGRVHDWRLSLRIREAVDVPVYLAGGLNAGNVRAAIERVRPFAVDLCTGLRTGAHLDPLKLAAFFAAVRGANAAVSDRTSP